MPVLDFKNYKDEFKEGLMQLVDEIFDTSIPFSQTSDTDKCRTCPFAGICGRE